MQRQISGCIRGETSSLGVQLIHLMKAIERGMVMGYQPTHEPAEHNPPQGGSVIASPQIGMTMQEFAEGVARFGAILRESLPSVHDLMGANQSEPVYDEVVLVPYERLEKNT